jgi:hypothetical protein
VRVPSRADIISYCALEMVVLPIAMSRTETQSAGTTFWPFSVAALGGMIVEDSV